MAVNILIIIIIYARLLQTRQNQQVANVGHSTVKILILLAKFCALDSITASLHDPKCFSCTSSEKEEKTEDKNEDESEEDPARVQS